MQGGRDENLALAKKIRKGKGKVPNKKGNSEGGNLTSKKGGLEQDQVLHMPQEWALCISVSGEEQRKGKNIGGSNIYRNSIEWDCCEVQE